MDYWFLYKLSDGSIYGAPYLGTAKEWTNIPIGCAILGPFNEITASAMIKDAYIHPNYYLVKNNDLIVVSNLAHLQLQDMRRAKISEVTSDHLKELNGTFTSSATGIELVYDYSPTSQILWKELMDAINANYVSDSLFPMNITLANGTNVAHTKIQLQQIFGEIVKRKLQLYGKLQGMITAEGTIMSATTIDAVNLIKW